MKLILLVLILVSTAGCGKLFSHSKKHKSSDALSDYHKRPLPITQTENISFVRKKRMRTEYDCNGHVTYHGYKTTNALSEKITVHYENRKKAWDYDIYNRTTNSGGGKTGTKEGKFYIDHSPNPFHVKVKTGRNLVEYVFKRCTQTGKDPQGNTICVGAVEVEKEGLVEILVDYRVELIEGEDVIRATNCPPANN